MEVTVKAQRVQERQTKAGKAMLNVRGSVNIKDDMGGDKDFPDASVTLWSDYDSGEWNMDEPQRIRPGTTFKVERCKKGDDYNGTPQFSGSCCAILDDNPAHPASSANPPDGYKPAGGGVGGSGRIGFNDAVSIILAANSALGVSATSEQATSLFIAIQQGKVSPPDDPLTEAAKGMGAEEVRGETDDGIPFAMFAPLIGVGTLLLGAGSMVA